MISGAGSNGWLLISLNGEMGVPERGADVQPGEKKTGTAPLIITV